MKAHKNNKAKVVTSDDERLTELFVLRFTARDIDRIYTNAKKNGFHTTKSGGASGYIRKIVLNELQES